MVGTGPTRLTAEAPGAPVRLTGNRRRKAVVLLAVVLVGTGGLAFGGLGGAQTVRASATPIPGAGSTPVPAPTSTSTPTPTTPAAPATPTPTTPAAPATPTTTTPAVVTPAPTAAAALPDTAPVVAAATSGPTVATLVAEVEATGVEPGPNWSWTMGDTQAVCGAIPGDSAGTGCTSGAAGAAKTVFDGVPSLALVAHELANAETENDAVPSVIAEVTAAEAGSSWSPIDAVATCLVEHFMGFEDDAAGAWQCPAGLAAVVAANIHDTISATA